jgi:hypothetical protein
MVAGEQTQGRRVYATRTDESGHKWYAWPKVGDYWLDENTDTWYACVPSAPPGVWGNLTNHQVVEHEDGTITVSPSILVNGGSGFTWHGFLEHGTWREV